MTQLRKSVQKSKALAIIVSSLILAACSSAQTKPDEIGDIGPKENMVCKIPMTITDPHKINWEPVRFYVINRDIMRTILAGDTAYPSNLIAMDAENYENLALNIQSIINHLRESRLNIESREKYYKAD